MIKKIRKILPVLLLTLVLVSSMSGAALAESSSYEGVCSFTGSKMVSSFSSAEVARAVENLQPGDDVTFTVTYKNLYGDDTDWYMENSVIRTLENTDKRKKNAYVTGNDDAENGGYTYELTQYSASGEKKVLFSNSRLGGDEGTVPKLNGGSGNMTGLEPATNALDEWFFIDTLAKNETGKVVLHVAFDGETEVNDYMDTNGELNLRFAVELPESGSRNKKTVKTGDQTNLIRWAVICLASGILLFMLFLISRRKDREARETAGGRGRSGRSGRSGGRRFKA